MKEKTEQQLIAERDSQEGGIVGRLWWTYNFLKASEIRCKCDVPIVLNSDRFRAVPPLCMVCGCVLRDNQSNGNQFVDLSDEVARISLNRLPSS